MGNNKIVKTAAAVALGASVVATAAAPGAASAATTYKIKSGKLVNAKTGKVVKGFKTYKSVLYKDGKKYKGLRGGKFYIAGKLGSGKYQGVRYQKGIKFTGVSKADGKFYKNGVLGTAVYKDVKYKKGVPFTGVSTADKKYYVDGKLATGNKVVDGVLYVDGVKATGKVLNEDTLYVNGTLPTEVTTYGEGEALKYYGTDGKLYNGKTTVDGKEVEVKDGVIVVASDLKIDSASANDNKTVTVKLAAPFEGEVKAADFKIEGLEVTEATLGTSKDTVILKTAAQEADKQYTVVYQENAENKATFVGKAAEGQQFDFSSATARTNTEVTVVLSDAPLKTLTKDDFQIAGLTVESVTLNNNIVTLKTSPQTAGTTYTVTSPIGGGSANFTGLAAVDASGVVSGVTLENARQIKVQFNRAITWETAQDLSKYYIGLTDDKTGVLTSKSIPTLAGATKWRVISNGQVEAEAGNKGTVDYVIIESTDGSTFEGLGIEEKQNVTIQTRGLKDANGYTSNSEGTFLAEDKVKPVASSATTAAVNGLYNESATYNGYTLEPAKAYLPVQFNEAVKDFDGENFKIYVDGLEVKKDATTGVKVVKSGTDFIKQNGTVVEGSTLLLDVTSLDRGEHDLKIVGANDLKDNVMSPNPYQTKFTVSDEVVEAPPALVKPKVTNIKQVADDAIEVYFDQPNVKAVPNTTQSVTIKGADFAADGKTAEDVKIDNANIVALDVYEDETATKKKVIGTKWVVKLPANVSNKTGVDYLDQQQILRNIEVKNFQVGTETVHAYYQGDVTTQSTVLQLDRLAPEIQTLTTGTENNKFANEIHVAFTDAPFAGDIKVGTGKIKVSLTDKDGKTTDEYIDVTDKTIVETSGNVLTVKLPNDSKLLTDKKELFAQAVYTLDFPENSVFDAQESVTGKSLKGDATTLDLTNIVDYNGIKKVAKSVTTPAANAVTEGEGLVPQTTKGLIQSGLDIKAGVTTATNKLGSPDKVGTVDYMKANPNYILVAFDGEVLESSALNKGNYKFNGAALPANAKVTFYTGEINDNISIEKSKTTDNFVIIELPEGSVQKEGQYDVEVFNITNKNGKVMLPVSTSVKLADNTKPTVKAAKVTGSKQVELTFDEKVVIKDASLARGNFYVTVNGQSLAVAEVKQGSADNKLDLVLSQDFAINGAKVNVQIKEDANKRMHITDDAKNDLSAGVVNN
jgi:trimeric autotransporter adhesin